MSMARPERTEVLVIHDATVIIRSPRGQGGVDAEAAAHHGAGLHGAAEQVNALP
jgi:hypothetical protein